MNWKGVARKFFGFLKAAAPIIAPVATAFGIPFVGTILNAVAMAETKGGSGAEKFSNAMDALSIAAPLIIDQLERQLGVDIPDEAAEAYIKAQTQAHVDLMNAVKLLPKK